MFYWAFVFLLSQSGHVLSATDVDIVRSDKIIKLHEKDRNITVIEGMGAHNRDKQECILKFADLYMTRHKVLQSQLLDSQEMFNGCSCGCSSSEVWDDFSKKCVALPSDIADVPMINTPNDKGKQMDFKKDDTKYATNTVPNSRLDFEHSIGKCGANCQTCARSVDDADEFKEIAGHTKWCLVCDEGYGLDNSKDDELTCQTCDIANCGRCDGDKTKCDICKDGYYGKDDENEPTRSKPIESCVKCPSDLGAVTKCAVKDQDLMATNAKPYVVATECKKVELSDFEDKETAYDMHYLRSHDDAHTAKVDTKANGGKCLEAGYGDECEAGCRYCNNANDRRGKAWCRQCEPGYELQDGRCFACPPNCNDCTHFECNHCKSGYFVGWDGRRNYQKGCVKCQEDASGAPLCFKVSLPFILLSILGIFQF